MTKAKPPADMPTILVVDDVPQNLIMLSEMLRGRYRVKVAAGGAQALKLLRSAPPVDLVLLDVVMPGMDGYAVCSKLKAMPALLDVPVIFLTVLDDPVDEEMGLGLGAVDFITKPISPPIVLARIDVHLRLKAASDALRVQNRFLEREVRRRMQAVAAEYDAIIVALATQFHAREQEGSNHILRLQAYMQALAERLQGHPLYSAELPTEAVQTMVKAVALHDIGMVGVPDSILFKVGALTESERDVVRLHAERGRALMQQVEQRLGRSTDLLRMAQQMAYSHQEHWDGSGYPQGLAGEAIPLCARLAAVVDAYESLVSGRLYRLPMAHEMAVKTIGEGRGRKFDKNVVDAFLAIDADFRALSLQHADSDADTQMRLRAFDALDASGG